MAIELDELRRLSRLIDEAMALPAESRAEWLDQAPDVSPALKARLQRALRAADSALTDPSTASEPHVPSDSAQRAAASDAASTSPSVSLSASSGMQWLKEGQLASRVLGSMLEADATAMFSSGDMLDRYRLEQRLGSGGMGEVWLASRTDGSFSRSVAIKIPLQLSVTGQTKIRFARECQALARLNHPHIALLHDAGVSVSGRPYLVMEYVAGVSITVFADAKQLSIAARIRLFLQVLNAVAHAHGQLIVHRDLKPSNVLVTEASAAKLLDFGVASLLEIDDPTTADLTRQQGVAITPNYASPEQLRSEPVAVMSDVYSLGVMFYELLVGARPYSLKTGTGIDALKRINVLLPSRAVLRDALAAHNETQLRSLKKKLEGDLDAVAMKALAFDSALRYQTVREMADDLERALNHQPVRAASTGNLYLARKFFRRHWFAASAATALLVSLLSGAALTAWQAKLATAEAKRAQTVESFLLRVFDANTFAGVDPLNASGSTARELLDNGARLIEADTSLTGAPLRDVLSLMAEVNADLGEHREALKLAAKALQVEREANDAARNSRVIALQLIAANAAMLTGQKAVAMTHLQALDSAALASRNALSPSQTLLLTALNARVATDSDPSAAASLAAKAMASLASAENDRYLGAGIQRLAEVFSDQNNVATYRLQALSLALAAARHGEKHPRTIEARLRVIDAAPAAGDIIKAQQEILVVKATLTGQATPANPSTGGWWLPAGRRAFDSPTLLAAALTFSRFELDYGHVGFGLLDVAYAATIAARLRTGADTSLTLAARTAYASFALKSGQLELADIHTRAAVAAAKELRDDRAAVAAELRADYLLLQGDTPGARALLERANTIRLENATAARPVTLSHRLLREASIALVEGDWNQAALKLAILDTHLAEANYGERRIDAKRGALLRAFALLDPRRAGPDQGLTSEQRAERDNQALRLSAGVLAFQDGQPTLNNSEKRLNAAALVVSARAYHRLGELAAACDALAAASEYFTAGVEVFFVGAAGLFVSPHAPALRCEKYPKANAVISAVHDKARFARETMLPSSPLLTGRWFYVLN